MQIKYPPIPGIQKLKKIFLNSSQLKELNLNEKNLNVYIVSLKLKLEKGVLTRKYKTYFFHVFSTFNIINLLFKYQSLYEMYNIL